MIVTLPSNPSSLVGYPKPASETKIKGSNLVWNVSTGVGNGGSREGSLVKCISWSKSLLRETGILRSIWELWNTIQMKPLGQRAFTFKLISIFIHQFLAAIGWRFSKDRFPVLLNRQRRWQEWSIGGGWKMRPRDLSWRWSQRDCMETDRPREWEQTSATPWVPFLTFYLQATLLKYKL